MSDFSLTSLTAAALAQGDFRELLPEYYDLAAIVENSPWHNHQDVYSHSIKVMEGFEKVTQFEFLSPPAQVAAKAYFATQVGDITRLNRLRLVVLLHDISKPLVWQQNPDGTTACPGHEFYSAAMVTDFSHRLQLSAATTQQISQLVALHGAISEVVNASLAHPDDQRYVQTFAKLVPTTLVELMCFIYADILGSDLETALPAAFQERVAFLQTWLENHFRL